MRVLVCGGRSYLDRKGVDYALDEICFQHGITCVISGGASGADTLAQEWAVRNKKAFSTFYADWKKHGRAAGPIRNQQMIDDGKPDLIVAFPGGRGTADMVRRAHAAEIKVVTFYGKGIEVGTKTAQTKRAKDKAA